VIRQLICLWDFLTISRNTKLLRLLPQGFTATATVQVAGRGRGSHVWISPAGSLLFSTVVKHPMDKIQSAPVVFIQYLSAMAVVKGIKSYAKGYENLPIKMKWPNDICKCRILINDLSNSDKFRRRP
jgi:biotin--protein ligase